MANDIQQDPMFLDTAGGPISTGRTINIFKSVEWINPVTAGDKAYLLDKNEAVVCSFVCVVPGKGDSKWFGEKGQVFDGPFTLSILDSGALLVARV
jgi:hypothetical protein